MSFQIAVLLIVWAMPFTVGFLLGWYLHYRLTRAKS